MTKERGQEQILLSFLKKVYAGVFSIMTKTPKETYVKLWKKVEADAMKEHLIIDGNAVYEIDLDCMEKLEKKRNLEKKIQQETKRNGREYKRQESNRR